MLNNAFSTEEDLDIIIANIMKQSGTFPATSRTSLEEIMNREVESVIMVNIQPKTLPISIRKRILYNISRRAS